MCNHSPMILSTKYSIYIINCFNYFASRHLVIFNSMIFLWPIVFTSSYFSMCKTICVKSQILITNFVINNCNYIALLNNKKIKILKKTLVLLRNFLLTRTLEYMTFYESLLSDIASYILDYNYLVLCMWQHN